MEETSGTSVSAICTGENVSKEKPLKAPFPWMGGKSRIADIVWERFGNVDNYVEPFAGSVAVLLRRPNKHFGNGYRVETLNDLNHFVANFWRSVKRDPDAVAKWCDNPVIEADLHARHQWLMRSDIAVSFRERFKSDPECYDAKIAGWWAWGQSSWIGSGWCNEGFTDRVKIHNATGIDSNSSGVVLPNKRPHITGDFVPGNGVNANTHVGVHGRPQLTDAYDIGRGVNASADRLGIQDGICESRQDWIREWMRSLSDRLRLVRTCYGHWNRVCDSVSTMTRLGTTGVFIDPPYPINRGDTGEKSRDGTLYASDKDGDTDALRDEVLAWCKKWGVDGMVKIAVCGYEGDGYEQLISLGWEETAWEASGGYANQKQGKQGKADNAKRERIWWSPACKIPVNEYCLFE